MSATKRTRERIRDLENRVEYLEDQLLELNDTVQDLKSATGEILTVVEEMTGQPGSGHLRKSSEAPDINDAIGQVAGMLQGGKGSGGLGDLLGLLFRQPASAGDDKEEQSEGEAKQQLAEGGRLTSAALSLTESIQTIATTAQQLLPLLILIDKFQETEAFQKLASYLLPPPPKAAISASTAAGKGRKN